MADALVELLGGERLSLGGGNLAAIGEVRKHHINDGLYAHNLAFHEYLTSLGTPHNRMVAVGVVLVSPNGRFR